MALQPADIATLSRLLDEGLALQPHEREAWLAGLPAEQQHLAAALRAMFTEADATQARLATLPKLGSDDAVAHAGERVGAYKLIREIGRGGMGSVWLAERADGSFERQIALKLPRLSWMEGLAGRMARERRIGALLEHANIARMYDAGVDELGRPYIAMEYIDGQAIDVWCRQRSLDVKASLRLFLQVVRAVAYAHGRLVIHRDLKPANVLVDAQGQTHLLDFGIAKLMDDVAQGGSNLTQEQGRVLTPSYAAPEQIAGQPIGVTADVYSLGVLLHELLTGVLPFAPKRHTLGAIEEAILEGDASLASSRVPDEATARALRGEVDAILGKSMRREARQRYATADALAADIQSHLDGAPVSARPDTWGYRWRKTARRHWVGIAALTAVLLAVVLGSVTTALQAQRAARSAQRERVVRDFVADVFRVNVRVDPRNATLRPSSTSQSLIEGGAALIQTRFAGQPELQSELYGVVSGVFLDMGAYQLAADYSTRKLEVLALMRSDATEQAKALMDLAQALLADEHLADAEARVRRAMVLAGADEALALDALVLMARIQFAAGHENEAIASTEEAERRLQAKGAGSIPAQAWATAMRARILVLQNRLDEAVPRFQEAIDQAEISEGRLSKIAVAIRLAVATVLAQTAHTEEAQRYFDAAMSTLHILGGAHETRAAMESARFAWKRRLAFYSLTAAQAVAALVESRDALQRSSLAVPAWFVPQIDFWIGDIRVDSGDVAGGLPLLESNFAALEALRLNVWARFYQSTSLGEAYMFAGRYELADRWLRDRLAARQQMPLRAKLPYAAADHFLIAQNLYMDGRYADALAVLKQVPHVDQMRGEGGNPDRYNLMLAWARAAVFLESGDFGTARRMLEANPPQPNEFDADLHEYHQLVGRTLCALGRAPEGLPTLQRLLAADEHSDDSPNAPWRAHLRAVTGQCALAVGDRRTALKYAEQARAIFEAQPGVGPYYKRPLLQLEKALGIQKRTR